MKQFHTHALSQISIWIWMASILPLIFLAGLFFLEFIGLRTYYHISLVAGATILFALSVVWCWWTLYTIAKVTEVLSKTSEKIDEVVVEVIEIKKDMNEIKK